MIERDFQEIAGENNEQINLFRWQVMDRLRSEHPELLEEHLASLESNDNVHRLFATRWLHSYMDVLDARSQAVKARRESGLFPSEDEQRRLA